MILKLEDSEAVAHLLGKQEVLRDGIKTVEEIHAALDKVTCADLKRVAEDLFHPEKMYLAGIGPWTDKDKFRERLVF